MNLFNKLPQFEKEFLKLSKKYRSLPEDLEKLEKLIALEPTGIGTNFVTVHHSEEVKIIKTRLACRSLRGRSIRIVYAYHQKTFTFVYIEIYFKGDKENEDRRRVDDYIKSMCCCKNNV
jgi:hypothetical protein